MRIKTLALGSIVVLIAVVTEPLVSAQQLKVIRLAAEGGSSVTTIHVDDRFLLAEFDGNSQSFLARDDAVFTINNKDKTYRVMTYQDLLTHFRNKAAETTPPQQRSDARGIELKLTEDTEIISGIRARKLVKTNNGQFEAEIWVSSELVPAKLRLISRDLRSTMPSDYWYRMNGGPGFVEIMMLYGIPLKMVSKGSTKYVAEVGPASSSNFSFEVPADYRKLDNQGMGSNLRR
jgi:hypothetical protein